MNIGHSYFFSFSLFCGEKKGLNINTLNEVCAFLTKDSFPCVICATLVECLLSNMVSIMAKRERIKICLDFLRVAMSSIAFSASVGWPSPVPRIPRTFHPRTFLPLPLNFFFLSSEKLDLCRISTIRTSGGYEELRLWRVRSACPAS